MRWTRRRWLQRAGFVSAAGLLRPRVWAQPFLTQTVSPDQPTHAAAKTLDASQLAPFVDPLPLPELQRPQGLRCSAALGAANVPSYAVHVRALQAKLHRDLPPTRLWSYGATSAPVLFEVQSGQGILIDWINDLPPRHFLPLSPAKPGMQDAPPTRICTHVHGARVPAISDGYPEAWYGPCGHRLCYYPNQQDAAMLWIHDHAMGVSLFNVFAGLMGWYIIRDEVERSLALPSGKYELPLLLCDRSFTPEGQLYYPNPPDEGSWSQSFLGDAMLVNGKVRPYHPVEPRRYRLRILNTANSRFFALSFSNGQSFHLIGSDQGLLAAPVEATRLVLAPGERTDMIVDFRGQQGRQVHLQSDDWQLLQFRIGDGPVEDRSELPRSLRPVQRISEQQALRTRVLTLNEFDNDDGMAMVMLLNRQHWADPVTERVELNSVEIWNLINLTHDTHPIHLHLVRFQILDRRSFSVDQYLSSDPADASALRYTGPALAPAPGEMGWKDVVQCPPGMVTRIIVPFQGYAGRYVWHCHLLEHQANEMMRPYDIVDRFA